MSHCDLYLCFYFRVCFKIDTCFQIYLKINCHIGLYRRRVDYCRMCPLQSLEIIRNLSPVTKNAYSLFVMLKSLSLMYPKSTVLVTFVYGLDCLRFLVGTSDFSPFPRRPALLQGPLKLVFNGYRDFFLGGGSCRAIDLFLLYFFRDRSRTVVKLLCYKSEGRWFNPDWCHPFDSTMALGSTQRLTEMSTRSISWG